MKVKMLTAMAGANISYTPGQVVEVKEAHGRAWIAAGIAAEAEVDAAAAFVHSTDEERSQAIQEPPEGIPQGG
ncbi:MAG: hypothetical protein AB1896_22370 [Thermodesulfobacteriota bacterium]